MVHSETVAITPLYQAHEAAGAKLVDFHGWMLPLQYTKVLEEHHAVRNAVGLFDIGHMGLIAVTGETTPAALMALDALLPQKIAELPEGKAVYTQFLNEASGILDDVIVYHLTPSAQNALGVSATALVICNASNREKIAAWLAKHLPAGVTHRELNDDFTLLALQGPQAEAVMASVSTGNALPARFCCDVRQFNAAALVLARTGYTGEDGFEIIVPNAVATSLWQALLANGSVLPCGLAARDTLRIESAYPLYGNDIDETTSPLEAGLGWSVPKDKAGDYIGKAAIQAQRATGVARKFVCLALPAGAIAREHAPLFVEGQPVGEVTSGSIAPTLSYPVAMGYVASSVSLSLGDLVQIEIRNKMVSATLVARPFYKRP